MVINSPIALIIADDSNSGTISVTIVDDDTPEIDESFVIVLNSVELVNDIDGGRDFQFDGDASLIDSEPILGAVTVTTVDIEENDDARGVFSFTSSSVTTTEGATLTIDIERSRGTFGTPSLHYTVDETGEGTDYSKATPNSPLVFAVGQSSRSITIQILDDTDPELQESFSVELTGVVNGGSLGDITELNVFIALNDNPYGRVTFSDTDLAGYVIDNPEDFPTSVSLTVERNDGLNGNIFVRQILLFSHAHNNNCKRHELITDCVNNTGKATFAI